ncbi:MAG TPA: ATP-dependent Clp protease ATP-binding subunit ClpA [Thermodesulfobacteriaceae bacterium]|nr:ATP-dependent Clp protease ATP-binding subunit ClpA [Thermodesulfobacteriaceae bacterium]
MISRDIEFMLGAAAREARTRHHEYLSLEHLLFAVIHHRAGSQVINACGGDAERLKSRIEHFFNTHIEKIPDGQEREPQPTVAFQRVIQRTIIHVQSAGKEQAEVGDLLAAISAEEDSYAVYFLSKEGITRLDIVNYISHGVSSLNTTPNNVTPPHGSEHQADSTIQGTGSKDALGIFTVNLIEKAAEGKLDPLVGRTLELERTMQVLSRRRKNNPIFVGNPGVGKTAMAEGLALKIWNGDVPAPLQDTEIFALDLGALLAGTKYRGEFESRLKEMISQIVMRPNAILFIDEIHTVVGAGATSGGSMDASNILKPGLSSGELRCIGSTTYEEYRNFFEKDRALSRRFQKIDILEPSIDETIKILRGLKSYYEDFHSVCYTENALKTAVRLSARYIPDRFLPDKAIDVIDEAASAYRLAGTSSSGPGRITVRHIENIIAKMARIPVKSVSRSDLANLGKLEKSLKTVVFGQDEAVAMVSKAVKRSQAGLAHPDRPIGSFLFTGPTGVGKTELARQVAMVLGINFQRFDMSEYMEKHAVARLIGAPPGYVGFDQGGLLTEAIRKHPYSVLLLDEIEKAHPDLFNILLQVMDYASLTDNTGRKTDFRHVILIMTSNAGAREMEGRTIGFGPQVDDRKHKGTEAVKQLFSPEFRNRLDAIVPFGHLTESTMVKIVDKLLDEIKMQLASRKIKLTVTAPARKWLSEKGYDPQFGARPLARLIQDEIKDPLADAILFNGLSRGGRITIGLDKGKIDIRINR